MAKSVWIRDLVASLLCLLLGSAVAEGHILYCMRTQRQKVSCTICASCKQTAHAASNSVSCRRGVHAQQIHSHKQSCKHALQQSEQQQQQIHKYAHARLNSVVADMHKQQIPWCYHAGKPDNICVQTCNVQGHKTCKYDTDPVMMPGLKQNQKHIKLLKGGQQPECPHITSSWIPSCLYAETAGADTDGKTPRPPPLAPGPFAHSPMSPWPDWESLPLALGGGIRLLRSMTFGIC